MWRWTTWAASGPLRHAVCLLESCWDCFHCIHHSVKWVRHTLHSHSHAKHLDLKHCFHSTELSNDPSYWLNISSLQELQTKSCWCEKSLPPFHTTHTFMYSITNKQMNDFLCLIGVMIKLQGATQYWAYNIYLLHTYTPDATAVEFFQKKSLSKQWKFQFDHILCQMYNNGKVQIQKFKLLINAVYYSGVKIAYVLFAMCLKSSLAQSGQDLIYTGWFHILQVLFCDFIFIWIGHVNVFLCPPLRKLQAKLLTFSTKTQQSSDNFSPDTHVLDFLCRRHLRLKKRCLTAATCRI